MPSGYRALRKIFIEPEAMVAAGMDFVNPTARVPTEFLVGTLGMKLEQELYMPDDMETGRLASYERSEVIARETTLPFEADANFNQFGHLLNMALGTVGTNGLYQPNQDGGIELNPYTFVYGDDQALFQSSAVLCRQLDISGTVGEVVRVNADLFGREVLPVIDPLPVMWASGVDYEVGDTIIIDPIGSGVAVYKALRTHTSVGGNVIDGAPDQVDSTAWRRYTVVGYNGVINTIPPVPGLLAGAVPGTVPDSFETIKMANCRVYEDPEWADVGSTQRTATLVDFNYRVMTGLTPLKFADNRIDFSEVSQAKRHVELEMTAGFTTDVSTNWYDYFLNQVPRVVELRFGGSNATKSLRLRVSGVITEYNELTEREGQDIVKLKWVSLLNQADPITTKRDYEVLFVGT